MVKVFLTRSLYILFLTMTFIFRGQAPERPEVSSNERQKKNLNVWVVDYPSTDVCVCFGVNDDGMVVIQKENRSYDQLDLYDSTGQFIRGIKIETGFFGAQGSHITGWVDQMIFYYGVRGDKVFLFSQEGELIDSRDVSDKDEVFSELFLLKAKLPKKSVNGRTYQLCNTRFNMTPSTFSTLKMIQGDETTILYEGSRLITVISIIQLSLLGIIIAVNAVVITKMVKKALSGYKTKEPKSTQN